MHMYENEFPEENDIVITRVSEITDTCIYVDLLEYDKRGLIILSELSRKKFKTLNKVVKMGKIEIAKVLRVDKIYGYIDLSKKKVLEEEKSFMEDKWNKSKTVQSIIRYISEKTENDDLHDLCSRISWPLYKDFDHAHDAFVTISKNSLFDLDLNISENEKYFLLEGIRHYMAPSMITLLSHIEITCFVMNGVDYIKQALKKGEELYENVSIRLETPPIFTILLKTQDVEKGKQMINDIIHSIQQSITSNGGNLCVKKESFVFE